MTDTAEAMRREAEQIQAARPDAIKTDPDVPVDVVVTVGAFPPGSQVCVRHRPYGVDVDYRERPDQAWSPLAFWGGRVELRPRSVLLPCEADEVTA